MTDPTPPIQPTTPPGSKTLIYSPQVRIVIASGGREIDVSKDVIRGRVVRVVDAMSNAEFYLNNKNGKYTGVIRRMDKVVIWMKRITWVQVFTGYLDIVPAYDLFPTEAYVRASCTLKRTKYTNWDPGLPASLLLLDPQINVNAEGIEVAQDSPDAATGIIIHDLLTKVGGWPINQVLIQQIPVAFMDFMKDNIVLVDQQEVFNRILRYIQGGGMAEGSIYPWTSTAGNVPAPSGANGKYTQKQVISLIKGAWSDSTLVSDDKIALAAAYAMKVSGGDPKFHRLDDGRDMYGLFGLDHLGASGRNLTLAQLQEPIANIKQAWIASGQGSNWSYWSNTLGFGNPPGNLSSVRQDVPVVAGYISDRSPTNPATVLSGDPLQALFEKFYGASPNEGIRTVLDFLSQQENKPYLLGATGPDKWDCSGLVLGAYKRVGIDLPHFAQAQASKTFDYRVPKSNGTSWTVGDLEPGDVIFFPGLASQQGSSGDIVPQIGHVGIYVGDGTMIEAGSAGVQYGPVAPHLNGSAGYLWTANVITRPIRMKYSLNDNTGTWQNTNENGGVNPAYRLFNFLFNAAEIDTTLSNLLQGDFNPANDESLLSSISQVCSGSMRSFMSGPNGDFIAFFPDYFGINNTQAVWDIEDVEIINLKLQINDDELVTHVFTIGDTNMVGGVDPSDWLQSAGQVSIMMKAIMSQILMMQSSTGFLSDPQEFLGRYGLRPMQQQLRIIRSHYYEFFSSLYKFLQQWSKQYSTDVQICFMPELFPGMRMNLANHDIAVYVESVIHVFDYQEGFQTYPTISCPSTPAGGANGLPIALGI